MADNLLVCSGGNWTSQANLFGGSSPVCSGTITQLDVTTLSPLAGMSYTDANSLLAAVVTVWALAWLLKFIVRFFLNQKG